MPVASGTKNMGECVSALKFKKDVLDFCMTLLLTMCACSRWGACLHGQAGLGSRILR